MTMIHAQMALRLKSTIERLARVAARAANSAADWLKVRKLTEYFTTETNIIPSARSVGKHSQPYTASSIIVLWYNVRSSEIRSLTS